MKKLTAGDFAASFGIAPADLPRPCVELIEACDFRYRVLQGKEREDLVLQVASRIDADRQRIGAEGRQEVWERGWREALDEYVASGFSEEKLVPKFVRPNQALRLNGEYVSSPNPRFELDYIRVLREWMFRAYFSSAPEVHEFGCGTGFNLLTLASIFPGKRLYGSDFVPASVELVNRIGERRHKGLSARLFDMTMPDPGYRPARGAGAFTFGSLEQLAGRFEAFLQFLLEKELAVCVHVEPTAELYDEASPFDDLALRFHLKRGYTTGLLPRLQELERTGRLKLLKVKRLGFGSLMMEGYTLMAWRPA